TRVRTATRITWTMAVRIADRPRVARGLPRTQVMAPSRISDAPSGRSGISVSRSGGSAWGVVVTGSGRELADSGAPEPGGTQVRGSAMQTPRKPVLRLILPR